MRYCSVSITKGWKRYTCSAYVLMWVIKHFDPNDETVCRSHGDCPVSRGRAE